MLLKLNTRNSPPRQFRGAVYIFSLTAKTSDNLNRFILAAWHTIKRWSGLLCTASTALSAWFFRAIRFKDKYKHNGRPIAD